MSKPPGPSVVDQVRYRATFDAALAVIRPRFALKRHEIGAALVSSTGATYLGINLKCNLGRASICAEGAAMAAAALSSDRRFTDLCVVHLQGPHPADGFRLVPPCGVCRELLLDFAPDVDVWIEPENTPIPVPLRDLMPFPYDGSAGTVHRPHAES